MPVYLVHDVANKMSARGAFLQYMHLQATTPYA